MVSEAKKKRAAAKKAKAVPAKVQEPKFPDLDCRLGKSLLDDVVPMLSSCRVPKE